RIRTIEPEQTGERRVTIFRGGATAYLKIGRHAPAGNAAGFVPLLGVDAVLTGAQGGNPWASVLVPPPHPSARLFRPLVQRGLASPVPGALLPAEQPFIYMVSATATAGVAPASVEAALVAELDRVRQHGVTDAEVAKAKAQLNARIVFDNDSVTNIAHQLGY